MSTSSFIPALIFMTLFAGLGFALFSFLSSLQRRSNRIAASDVLLGEDHPRSQGIVPNGALPELLSVVGIAVVAMGLLTYGYTSSGRANNSVAVIDSGTLSTPATPNARKADPSQPAPAAAGTPGVPTSTTSPGSGG
jgi:hypothetical protein